MSIEIRLPELGENIESADVLRVLVREGDTVAADQPILEIETEKATVDVPSSAAGRVDRLLVREGDKVKTSQVLMTIEPADNADPKRETSPPEHSATTPPKPAPSQQTTETVAAIVGPADQPVFAAPSVRQFAREIGIDVHAVPGSGPGGRISVEDVKAFARSRRDGSLAAPSVQPEAGPPHPTLPDFSTFGPVQRERMTGVRRTTARHVALCWSAIPHVTLFAQADITEVEQIRRRYKAQVERAGGKLTITAILLKIAAAALKRHPRLNASIDLAHDEIVLKHYYDIGVATDTDRGLVVPVIRGVDAKSITQLAADLTQQATRARDGKLSPDGMRGATFTITNLGSLAVGHFSPIVNWPEVAILGVGLATQQPAWTGERFEPRLLLPLSLSFDHRVVDGADGARFLHWIVQALQKPLLLVMEG